MQKLRLVILAFDSNGIILTKVIYYQIWLFLFYFTKTWTEIYQVAAIDQHLVYC